MLIYIHFWSVQMFTFVFIFYDSFMIINRLFDQ